MNLPVCSAMRLVASGSVIPKPSTYWFDVSEDAERCRCALRAQLGIRVRPNKSLTPYYNGFAVRTSNADGHVDQFGLGITVH